ncbi:mucolipin-2-like [Neolamprologus brichardi]|uniref:mucolipin-2-like n=1 Tax=Neolamprologus brichardi TaxID=32507 RepID=UPI001643839E|nr:mucolipin-2-like [Neolamprologus brichardi]
MELFSRYLDRSNSVSSVCQDIIKEDNLRDDLRYYFMSPCEKYRARRHIPWKMGVQILKIIMVTTQLVLFGLNNQLVVSYKEENTMALKHLFLKGYSGVDEDDYSVAVYTKHDVYESLFYVMDQHSQLDQLSVGPISYAEDENSKLLPLTICKEYYRRGSVEPSDEIYDIDAQLETVCMSHDPKTANLWRTENSSFFNLDFYRLVDIKITFQLKGINLQTVRSRELPDCYSFFVTITFDNQCHSGKVKLFLDIDAESSACRDWKISGTAQKNTHYLLVFDAFVILMCLTSAVLCTRSIILAVRLLQNLTNYDVCSIFLGTSTLLVWVGVIRYLGYFQKYNVLILTMKASYQKNGFPQTDLQKFLHEPTELPNIEESDQTDVRVRHSVLCYCQ